MDNDLPAKLEENDALRFENIHYKLTAAKADYDEMMRRANEFQNYIVDKYKVTPEDKINLSTGIITRVSASGS